MGAQIQTLEVRIRTSNRFAAGTDNDVYFDIGPLGWVLRSSRNDFERGRYDAFPLDLHGLYVDTDDIVWLRVQKKGLGGVNGTPDGPFNEWLPESIELIVNGQPFTAAPINVWLNWFSPVWSKQIQYLGASREEVFARTTRFLPNNVISDADKNWAAITTPVFKNAGISGWIWAGLPKSSAIGYVVRPPALSQDGFATIDIRLEALLVGSETYVLDGRHGIRGERYIRVEYKAAANWPAASGVEILPVQGQRVKISGVVKWDSDQEWWYEIHPEGSGDVEFLPPRVGVPKLKTDYAEPLKVGSMEGTFHWNGISGGPPSTREACAGGDFWYKASYWEEMCQIDAEVDNLPSADALRWTLEGTALAAGSGTLTLLPGTHSSAIPAPHGTRMDGAAVKVEYWLAGQSLRLWNRHEDANYTLSLTVAVDEGIFGQPKVTILLYFQGDSVEMDPTFVKLRNACAAAKEAYWKSFRTKPKPIPLWDPAPLDRLSPVELIGIIDRIREALPAEARHRFAVVPTEGGALKSEILSLATRFPEAVRIALGEVVEVTESRVER